MFAYTFHSLLAAIRWSASDTIFDLGFIELRWYGFLFALGFIIGFQIFRRIFQIEGRPQDDLDILLTYIAIATIVGARLGHCFFYDPEYYLANPLEILQPWKGGLASHGGTIGILVALYLYTRSRPFQPYLWLLDRIVIPIALAGAFIRLGNLMNSEIYGGETSLPWGFIFELRGETVAKHPTQIYEALAYTLLFVVLVWVYKNYQRLLPRGRIFGMFLVGLFGARLLIEFVKNVQEAWENDLVATTGLNMGQWLSVPFILVGLYFWVKSYSAQSVQEAIDFDEKFAKNKAKS
jgi:phosphatidylglycerol---prolipoprotein diacylglyceryl transferase